MTLSLPCIETIVLQPTPFCNIACDYCYLPNRRDNSVMSPDTIAATFERIFESGWSAPSMGVIWHAGEPLVLKPQYYRDAFGIAERLRPRDVVLRHSIQTNGMLLTPEWCDLFREHGVGVGVSTDGPKHLHDAHRKTRSGRGTFDAALAGIRLLRRHGIDFHVITVLTGESLDDPDALLAFYTAEGIDQVCFNVEESEGDHTSSLFAEGRLRERFTRFLERFWRAARLEGRIEFVREIDALLPRIIRPAEAEIGNEQATPLAMLTIGCNGDVSSFSPELLGLKDPRYGDFVIGNVHTHALADMLDSDAMRCMAADIAAGVAACRSGCDYFSVCGGGAPVNKLTENGSFATARTRFCELTQMVPTDIVLDALDRMDRACLPDRALEALSA